MRSAQGMHVSHMTFTRWFVMVLCDLAWVRYDHNNNSHNNNDDNNTY